MQIRAHRAYLTRDSVLKTLSDDEVARVAAAETERGLSYGEQYVDLEQLDLGVQTARGTSAPMAGILPRKAVREATWAAIVAKLLPSVAEQRGPR